jgi:lantibiotic biosynthesis protein
MKNYQLSPKLLLRTPLLALNDLIHKVLKSSDLSVLKAAYQSGLLQKALFLASPVLWEENQKWQRDEIAESDVMHLAQALWRYLLRMSSRCTPFGLFAGVTMGEWSNENNVVLQSADYQAHTRLDMEYLGALAQQLSQQEDIKEVLRFYPNNSLYESGERLRYVDYRYDKKRRIHQIVAIDNSVYIQHLLAVAKYGATRYELVQSIVSEDITFEEATDFIEEVIASQVLISELDGSTTGKEQAIYTFLKSYLKANKQEEWLKNVVYILEKSNYQLPPSEEFKAALTNLAVPYELNRLFQTDLEKKAKSCQLDKKIAGQLRKGLSFLNRLAVPPQESNLKKFADAYTERYESKELPLLEVLDVETGIGYLQLGDTQGDINPLVDGLFVGTTSSSNQTISWNTKQTLLLQKLLKAHQEQAKEVVFTHKEVEHFEEKTDDISASISVMFGIVGTVDNQPLIHLEHAGGNATRLLGRFTSMSEDIHQWCCDIAAAEQSNVPDAIIAEIVHLPENRVGNILMRSNFRAYEITYLAKSSVAEDYQIPLQDLMVSVQNGTVILRSKRLNKRIIPALGNAHNYSHNALPAYHFLCDLQTQNKRSAFGFHWGAMANQFSFLPRVRYENLIVHRATWQLKKADYEALAKWKDNELMEKTAEWKAKYQLPDRVMIVQGDNELLIDLRHELSVKTFIQEIKNLSNVQLAEFLFDEGNATIKDTENGVYTNEFVAVFTAAATVTTTSIVEESTPQVTNTERSFSIGSEWLYFKIYCGAATADELLCTIIYPMVQDFLEKNWIDQWFFIRYADPKNHIRIRFRLKNQDSLGKVSNAFYDNLATAIAQKQIWKLQTDTYEREIERYGNGTMALSEELFCVDSNATLDFLSQIDSFQSNYRWLYGVVAIDAMLNAFGYNLDQKTKLLEIMKTSFGKEFGMNKHLRKQLNEKYDTYEQQIQILFQNDIEDENLAFVKQCAYQCQLNLEPIAAQIKALLPENQMANVLSSYIHMTMNRLCKSKQRMYEMVVYDFAFKNYQTRKYKVS